MSAITSQVLLLALHREGFRMVVNLHTVIQYYRTLFSIIEQSNLKVL